MISSHHFIENVKVTLDGFNDIALITAIMVGSLNKERIYVSKTPFPLRRNRREQVIFDDLK